MKYIKQIGYSSIDAMFSTFPNNDNGERGKKMKSLQCFVQDCSEEAFPWFSVTVIEIYSFTQINSVLKPNLEQFALISSALFKIFCNSH